VVTGSGIKEARVLADLGTTATVRRSVTPILQIYHHLHPGLPLFPSCVINWVGFQRTNPLRLLRKKAAYLVLSRSFDFPIQILHPTRLLKRRIANGRRFRCTFKIQIRSFCRSLICPSQDVQKRMLGKEWLAKFDAETATPYLLVCSVPFTTSVLDHPLLD
jgi:hypothetical protein